MRKPSVLALFTILSLASFTGCGGSQPAAEEPKEEKTEEKSEAKKDEKKEEAKPAGGMPEVKRTAKDHLTAPDVVFMFSFNDSDPKKKAEERCEAQSKG